MKRQLAIALVTGLVVTTLSTVGLPREATAQMQEEAIVNLQMQDGTPVGTVWFSQDGDHVVVHAEVAGLPPGFHGFHVHTNGVCDPATQFMSAGGHMDVAPPEDIAGMAHMGHSGDMTNLYVTSDGTGTLTSVLDRFTLADLFAAGGRAVVVHADADNFANFPSRYGVTPDQMTLDTGDAGARIACGVVQPA
jgi:Cu-Zn family superoxide dismutase